MFSATERNGTRLRVGLLEDEADRLAAVLRALAPAHREEVVTVDGRRAGGGGVQARQDRQERRLARSGGAHDRRELARLDLEVEALQRLHLHALGREDAHEVDATDLSGPSIPILSETAGDLRPASPRPRGH